MLRPDDAKYVVIPGYVTSVKDGQDHYVTADRLIQLYQVPRQDCVVFDYSKTKNDPVYETRNMWKLDLVKLTPKADGDYACPVFVWPFPIVIGDIPK